jgi:hypothetical protein
MPSLTRIVDPLSLVGSTTRLVATTTSAAAKATTDAGLILLARALATQAALDAVDVVLRSPAARRAVRTAIRGPLPEVAARAAVHERVLEREGVEQLVEEIASSPLVAQAIARQGAGFADRVAGEVAQRSQRADDRLERATRRLLHRRPLPEPADGPIVPSHPS